MVSKESAQDHKEQSKRREIRDKGQARERPASPGGREAAILRLQRLAGNQAVTSLVQAKLTVGAADDVYEREADRLAEQVLSQQPPAVVNQGNVQRQIDEEELQTKSLLQRQEEEEELQTKPLLQRQEEEEELQTKPLLQRQEEEEELQTKPLLQRQEEEEELQTKSLLQRQEEEEELQTKSLLQRQEEEEELQTKPLLQRQEEEEELQTKPLLQRRGDGGFEASAGLEDRLEGLKGGGSPLPEGVRGFMEPRFGADFGGVRLHTGAEAAQLNRALNARAFTHGKDIYLGSGTDAPGSAAGNRLLAHELAHTLQQGATKRIAGWWADGHKMLTLTAGYEQPEIDKSVVEWLADHAGSQDITMRSITNFAIWGGFKQKGAKKKWASKDTTLLDKKKMWETGGLMVRMGQERPFHGEASAYQDGVDNTEANKQAVTNQIKKAQAAYRRGFYREGLLQFSDALHTAEDRGSHGEGLAWSGHDPRLALPQKWDGTANENYRPGWDCDNVAKNAGGRVLGEKYAKQAYQAFLAGLGMEEKLKLGMGIGAKKTSFNWFRDWGSRIFHGFRHTIGGIAGLAGEKALEPAEDKIRNLEEYKQLKEKYPSIQPEDLEQLAIGGQRGTESKRGFEKYKQIHLNEVRTSIKNQLVKILQAVNGNMDPFTMETSYKMYSNLQKTARDYDSTIAGIDDKSDERTLVAQPIEQDAMQWKQIVDKYTSLRRKVWRFGRDEQRRILKEDIKAKAPEHLAFVTSHNLQGQD